MRSGSDAAWLPHCFRHHEQAACSHGDRRLWGDRGARRLLARSCRAAKYLTVGQIYLLATPLLREPLRGAYQATPVVLNETRRADIAMDAIRRSRRPPKNARELTDARQRSLAEHRAYVAANLQDMPAIRDFRWTFG